MGVTRRRLPCCARDLGPCWGRIEADHAGPRPLGRKCSDDETIPLCSGHHRARTDLAGPFRGWGREQMRAWLDAQIEQTQAAMAATTSTAGAAGIEAM